MSWAEAAERVSELAAGFLDLGVRRGERVGILSRTRLEWSLCDWALIAIGALTVPLYPTSSATECTFILSNAGVHVVVCEDERQRAKLDLCSQVRGAPLRLVALEDLGSPGATSLAELAERGRALLASDPGVLERARAAIAPEDPLTIIYTSGTTGPPKGCVLLNRNYMAMADAVSRVEGLVVPGDRVLLHLPLAHNFARLVQFLGAGLHISIAFCPDPAGLPEALREVRPTIFPSVPRFYERVAAAIRAGLEAQPAPTRSLARFALAVGERAGARREQGRPLGVRLRLELAVADRLVLRRVRNRLGGRLRVAVSGAAPLDVELGRFFLSFGLPLLDGYGQTECTTAATFNRPHRFRLGTVGLPFEGFEVRIAKDGEIEVRSETVFQGYYGDAEATRAVIGEDGWLHTGDLGSLDADGFLTITGRKKEIIVSSGGVNVSPANVETALEHSAIIAQACVVGDRRPYLVALLTLDQEAAGEHTPEEIRELCERAVKDVNAGRGRAEQVRRFAVLDRPFSEEEGELTPTLKLRRRVVEEHFGDVIDRLYAGA